MPLSRIAVASAELDTSLGSRNNRMWAVGSKAWLSCEYLNHDSSRRQSFRFGLIKDP